MCHMYTEKAKTLTRIVNMNTAQVLLYIYSKDVSILEYLLLDCGLWTGLECLSDIFYKVSDTI